MSLKEKWMKFSPLPEDIGEKIYELRDYFKKKGVKLVYLFGSSLKKRGQDVDLGILKENGDIYKMKNEIYEILGTHRVDIIDLKRAPLYMKYIIISTGKVIYKESDEVENSFEMKILKLYKDGEIKRKKHFYLLKEKFKVGI